MTNKIPTWEELDKGAPVDPVAFHKERGTLYGRVSAHRSQPGMVWVSRQNWDLERFMPHEKKQHLRSSLVARAQVEMIDGSPLPTSENPYIEKVREPTPVYAPPDLVQDAIAMNEDMGVSKSVPSYPEPPLVVTGQGELNPDLRHAVDMYIKSETYTGQWPDYDKFLDGLVEVVSQQRQPPLPPHKTIPVQPLRPTTDTGVQFTFINKRNDY